jgi:hypothetical protein
MDYGKKLWAAIYYGELRLFVLFTTESHCSPHRLKQGVNVDSRESFFKILGDSSCRKRDIEAKNQ